jgi:hypothetical protein
MEAAAGGGSGVPRVARAAGDVSQQAVPEVATRRYCGAQIMASLTSDPVAAVLKRLFREAEIADRPLLAEFRMSATEIRGRRLLRKRPRTIALYIVASPTTF